MRGAPPARILSHPMPHHTDAPRARPPAPRRAPPVHTAHRAALSPGNANARTGEANGNAKVTAATVRAWRREAATVARARLRETRGWNAKTGAPLASLLRGTGVFARLARANTPPVSVAAVCMAVYGDTWADLPGALPRYTPLSTRSQPRRDVGGRSRPS